MQIKFLFLLCIWFNFAVGATEKLTIRVGHFPTLTHAQGLIGHELTREGKGWFEERLGPDVKVEWFAYDVGTSAMESLLTNALDLTYVGPSPTINAYVKSKGQDVRIVCGSCSGGSALVVQPERIKTNSDFLGKKIATPQFGNTQDVVARAWLQSQGFKVSLTGGDVKVIPLSGSSQLILLQQGDLDGAWNIEPWVSRLVLEANGEVYLDESALRKKTGGMYVTTHLVSSKKFIDQHPEIVKKWVQAHVELTKWINEHPEEAKIIANKEIENEVKKKLSSQVLDRAWKQLTFTLDPISPSLFEDAEMAYQIGFLKEKPDLSQIYDLSFLKEITNGISP